MIFFFFVFITHQHKEVLYSIYYFRDFLLILQDKYFDRKCSSPLLCHYEFVGKFQISAVIFQLMKIICKIFFINLKNKIFFLYFLFSFEPQTYSLLRCLPSLHLKDFKMRATFGGMRDFYLVWSTLTRCTLKFKKIITYICYIYAFVQNKLSCL